MGIFDKRRKSGDEFQSPVEFIDLAAAREETAPAAAATSSSSSSSGGGDATPSSPDYGIDKAIALMRQLPQDNVALIVQVVKATLESLHVQVPTILQDAAHKLQRIESRVATLKGEITELQREIEVRRTEITKLEGDHEETTRVRDRLLLAEGKPKAESAAAGADKIERKSSSPPGGVASVAGGTLVAGVSGRPKA